MGADRTYGPRTQPPFKVATARSAMSPMLPVDFNSLESAESIRLALGLQQRGMKADHRVCRSKADKSAAHFSEQAWRERCSPVGKAMQNERPFRSRPCSSSLLLDFTSQAHPRVFGSYGASCRYRLRQARSHRTEHQSRGCRQSRRRFHLRFAPRDDCP